MSKSKLTITDELGSLQKLLEKIEKQVVIFRKDIYFEQTHTFYEKSMKLFEMYELASQELGHKLFYYDHFGIKEVTETLTRGYRQLLNTILKFSIAQFEHHSAELEQQSGSKRSGKGAAVNNSASGHNSNTLAISHAKTYYNPNDNGNASRNNEKMTLNIPVGARVVSKHAKINLQSPIQSRIDLEEEKMKTPKSVVQSNEYGHDSPRNPKPYGSIGDVDYLKTPQSYFENAELPSPSRSIYDLADERKSIPQSTILDTSLRAEDVEALHKETEKTKQQIDEALKSMKTALKVKASGSTAHLRQVLHAFNQSKDTQKGLVKFQREIDGSTPSNLGPEDLNEQLLKVYDKTQRKTAQRVLSFVGKQEQEQKSRVKALLNSIGTDPDYAMIEQEKNDLIKQKDEEYEKLIYTKDLEIKTLKEKYQEEHEQFTRSTTEALHYKLQAADYDVERTGLTKQIRELKAELASHIEKLAKKKFKIQELKAEMKGKENSINEKHKKFDILIYKNNELTTKNRELEAQIEELKNEIAALNSKTEERNEEFQAKKTYLEDLVAQAEKENEGLHEKIEKLEAEIKQLTETLASERVLRSKQMILEMQIDETKTKFHREKDRVERLTTIYDHNMKLLGDRRGISMNSIASIANLDEQALTGKLNGSFQDSPEAANLKLSIMVPNTQKKVLDTSLLLPGEGSRRGSRTSLNESLDAREPSVRGEELEDRGGKSRVSDRSNSLIQKQSYTEAFYPQKDKLSEHNSVKKVEEDGRTPKNILDKINDLSSPPDTSSRRNEFANPITEKNLQEPIEFSSILNTEKIEKVVNGITEANGTATSKQKATCSFAEKETQTVEQATAEMNPEKPSTTNQNSMEGLQTNDITTKSAFLPMSLADTVKNLREQGVTLQQLIELYEPKAATPHLANDISKPSYSNQIKKLSRVFEHMQTPATEYGQQHNIIGGRANLNRPLFKSPRAMHDDVAKTERQQLRISTEISQETQTTRLKAETSLTKTGSFTGLDIATLTTETSPQLARTSKYGESTDVQFFTKRRDTEKDVFQRSFRVSTNNEKTDSIDSIGELAMKKHKRMTAMYDSLLQRLGGNPSLKKLFKDVAQRRYKQLGKRFDAEKFEIDFEDFAEYYETLERIHKKCGENCPHLRRFYDKIGYWPHAEDRALFPLRKTDIDRLPRIVRKIYLR